MKVGILNVTGYAGSELARILANHPKAELVAVTGRSDAGKRLSEVFPHLSAIDLPIVEEIKESVDIVFSALPHKASAEACGPFFLGGVKVVDISADFRLKDLAEYESWYDVQHPLPELMRDAVYGLPELHRSEIAASNLVANPGCYPTGAILALAPAVKAGIIDPDVIVDGKSGVSGAGRGLGLSTHYSEVNESVRAYSMDGHRHMPEITQELREVSKQEPRVTFMPHLIPMTRGILSSCYASLKPGALPSGPAGIAALREVYEDFYRDEPFVKIAAQPPHTKHTLGNNDCVIYPTIDLRTNRLTVVSAIDNLVKGAAGQAVQNMNIMFGLPEIMGLTALALYP
jgi:N-acetyl-gamma-glutamyl-phosphate reductase